MIVIRKKILPRRKCVSYAYNYEEQDVDADDSFICEYFQFPQCGSVLC